MAADATGITAARITLVSGPASSGKSVWAEHLAAASGLQVCYLATGPQLPDDPAWQARLLAHRQRRPRHWLCQDVALALPEALQGIQSGQLALVDSLGTWVASGLDLEPDSWERHCQALQQVLPTVAGPVILVAEETGWGVVPSTAAGGVFRERLGSLTQRLMPSCDAAWLVLHGRALDLMRHSVPVVDAGIAAGTC
ncbi:MAG: bifunctional adenosylcobinamide kinase/adenosylcobinamide-phosphate guanylyltransferase [Synechococcaceae bacterium WB9_2_112]|nr:bifunctional adenosylcobinamide kinase/adenosylcobinamide-phosphate guanylyltransferase [Synechococcaceae bacterium WB9_2_112]